jgi:hypothetical protein
MNADDARITSASFRRRPKCFTTAKLVNPVKHDVRSTQQKSFCVLRTVYWNWIPACAGMTA